MTNLFMDDPSTRAMVEMAAKDFFDSGRVIQVGKNYLRFSEPWYIRVQSLGGGTCQPESSLTLLLNTKDSNGFHQEQRAYVNRQERSIQAAVFVTLQRSCFINSLLGPSDSPSVFAFPFISNLVAIYSVQFAIRGAKLSPDGIVDWDFGIYVLDIQPSEKYWDGSFKRLSQLVNAEPTDANPRPSPAASPASRPSPAASPDPRPSPAARPAVSPDPRPSPTVSPAARPDPRPSPAVSPAVSPAPASADRASECTVCFEELVQRVALVPCGHTTFCQECGPKLITCPICRAPVQSILKLFV